MPQYLGASEHFDGKITAPGIKFISQFSNQNCSNLSNGTTSTINETLGEFCEEIVGPFYLGWAGASSALNTSAGISNIRCNRIGNRVSLTIDAFLLGNVTSGTGTVVTILGGKKLDPRFVPGWTGTAPTLGTSAANIIINVPFLYNSAVSNQIGLCIYGDGTVTFELLTLATSGTSPTHGSLLALNGSSSQFHGTLGGADICVSYDILNSGAVKTL